MKCLECGDNVHWGIDQWDNFCIYCDGGCNQDCSWSVCDQYSKEQPEILQRWWKDLYRQFQQVLDGAPDALGAWKCTRGEWKRAIKS